jgi:hypothetical protein
VIGTGLRNKLDDLHFQDWNPIAAGQIQGSAAREHSPRHPSRGRTKHIDLVQDRAGGSPPTVQRLLLLRIPATRWITWNIVQKVSVRIRSVSGCRERRAKGINGSCLNIQATCKRSYRVEDRKMIVLFVFTLRARSAVVTSLLVVRTEVFARDTVERDTAVQDPIVP